MPTSEAPTDVNEPQRPSETAQGPAGPDAGSPDPENPASAAESRPRVTSGGSRWVDYDTHELLDMIGELEDERRFARLREGILWAVLVHIALISGLTWIPMYVLKQPRVVDPFDAIKQRKDLTYLDLPPDALKNLQPKTPPKPVKPQIDKKTLEEMQKAAPPKPEAEAPPPQPAPEPPKPEPTQPLPQNQQSQVEAPRPAAVPARPNFAQLSQNPADQLRQDEQNAMRGRGAEPGNIPSGGLPMHPGASTGGVQVLNPEPGVDLSAWLQRWYYETRRTWEPLIPDEVNAPILKQGQVMIRFRVLPDGRIVDPNGMFLEGRSGDPALDRAAWGAIIGSSYPALPKDFHGPYLELRALFMYNMQPQ